MPSLTEARHRMAAGFIARLDALFTPVTVDRILSAMFERRPVTLRTNLLKSTTAAVREALTGAGLKFETVAWYRDAFILRGATETRIEKTAIYSEGQIYLQSLSSMVPALALAPRPGETILDLTAAPGSKTTQIASMAGGQARITAVERDRLRFERLEYNLRLQSAAGVECLNLPAEKLLDRHPRFRDYFDKVLLDAPCSGEGRFLLSDPQTFRHWSEKEVRQCANLQAKLIRTAVDSLKPGGIMVYSTCTMNTEENEAIIAGCLRDGKMRIEDPAVLFPAAKPGFTAGFVPELSRALRILPDRLMEGFFVCKLRKDG